MRNIILAMVAIVALTAAGIGGVFADFSDIEISEDNYFKTGSLDLTVSNYLGIEYNGDIIPALFQYSDAWPCSDKSFYFDLENWGQGSEFEPYAYIHFKNFECCWVMPKYVAGVNEPMWIDCDDGECVEVDPPDPLPVPGYQGTGLPKPVTEPEYVAECGGIAGENATGGTVEVPGVGCCFGEDCKLPEHIGVMIWTSNVTWPHEQKPVYNDPGIPWGLVYNGKMNLLECDELELGQIPNCEGMWVHISFHLQDIDEDDLIEAGVLTDPGTGYGWFEEKTKWDHWPTNAIQKDGVVFDIAFELLQNPAP